MSNPILFLPETIILLMQEAYDRPSSHSRAAPLPSVCLCVQRYESERQQATEAPLEVCVPPALSYQIKPKDSNHSTLHCHGIILAEQHA